MNYLSSNIINNKFLLITVMVIGILIGSVSSIYAIYKYSSKDICYIKSDGNEISVEDALNDLYKTKFDGMQRRESNQIPEGVNEIKVLVVSCATGGVGTITIDGDIVVSYEETSLGYDFVSRQYEIGIYEYDVKTNGMPGTVNVQFNGFGVKSDYYYVYY